MGCAVLDDEVDLILMIFLTEDEVPSDVSHQTDMAGHTKFQSGTDLTEHWRVVIVNRINRPIFFLPEHEIPRRSGWVAARSVSVFFMKILVERCATLDETETARDIRGETAEGIACGQGEQSTTRKIRFGGKTDCLNAGPEVTAPEIFHVDTTTPGIVTRE